MIPYKTSKDYKRLKELLDQGKMIVCFYDEIFLGHTTKRCIWASKVKFQKGACYHVCCDIYDVENNMEQFFEIVEKYNVEFIEPNL